MRFTRKMVKRTFVVFLIISWTFSRWPVIPFINFPPKIKEAQAAISFSNLGTSANPDINDGSNAASYANTSWTPPTSGLILLFVTNHIAAIGNVPTVSGNSLTWTQIHTFAVDPGTSHRITLFAADAAGSTTGATTIDFNTQTQLDLNASFFHVTGADLSGGVAAAFVQTPTNSGTGLSGSVTLAAAGNSANRPIAAFTHLANEVTSPDAAWTEIDDFNGAGAARGVETQWDADGFQDATASWASSVAWIGMAAEIKASLVATLTQNDFEIFVDNDALTPTDEWPSGSLATGENGAVTALPVAFDPLDPADEVRIRMNIAVSELQLEMGAEGFILQYKETNDCTDGTSWTDVDVAAGGGTWRYAASSVTDNTTLTTLKISTSNVAGRYNKSDPSSTNPNAVPSGQNVEWDWHVEYNGDAAAHVYCFRMVNDAGGALNAYNADSYPKIETRPGISNLLRHGEFFSTGSEKGFFWAD